MSRAKRTRKKENVRAAREARAAALKRQHRKTAAVRVLVGFVVVALIIGVSGFLAGRGDDDDTAADDATTTVPTTTVAPVGAICSPSATDTTLAKITTNFGEIDIALDTTNAPIGAQHFIDLAKLGFYDGLTWHRAATDFVIQGGDPTGDGSGGSGNPIVAEIPTDNYPIGALAAAKTETDAPGTFDSQFYVVTGSNGATLPNDYARFGCVVTGLEVAKQIESLAPAEGDGPPTSAATIDKVEIVESTAPDASTTTAPPAETTTTGA